MEKLKNPKFLNDIKELRKVLIDKIGALDYLLDVLEGNPGKPLVQNASPTLRKETINNKNPQIDKVINIVHKMENDMESFEKQLSSLDLAEPKKYVDDFEIEPL